MNVLQILTDASFSVVGITTTNDKIASCTSTNLLGQMAREDILAVTPLNLNLKFD